MNIRNKKKKIKVLLCMSQIEGHDRGVKYISRKLFDSGMEVTFTVFGLVDEIINKVSKDDPDVIGVTSSIGGHLQLCRDLIDGLKGAKIKNKVVIFGGLIAVEDIPLLKKMGVSEVFGPGTNPDDVTNHIEMVIKGGKNVIGNNN